MTTYTQPTSRRPEGTMIEAGVGTCGHKVRITWDGRFAPDARERELAFNQECRRCKRKHADTVTLTLSGREGLVLRRMLERAAFNMDNQELDETTKRLSGVERDLRRMMRDEARTLIKRIKSDLTDQGVSL